MRRMKQEWGYDSHYRSEQYRLHVGPRKFPIFMREVNPQFPHLFAKTVEKVPFELYDRWSMVDGNKAKSTSSLAIWHNCRNYPTVCWVEKPYFFGEGGRVNYQPKPLKAEIMKKRAMSAPGPIFELFLVLCYHHHSSQDSERRYRKSYRCDT